MHGESIEARAQRLVSVYSDTVLRLCYTYLHSRQDAEDACQDVFMKILTKAPEFKDAEHEKAWILRVSINQCKDMLKSAARRRNTALENAPEPVAPPEPQGPDEDILAAVQSLPENYREAIHLYYYEGYSIAEIAEMTAKSEQAVGQHLSRGRKKLREILGGGRL